MEFKVAKKKETNKSPLNNITQVTQQCSKYLQQNIDIQENIKAKQKKRASGKQVQQNYLYSYLTCIRNIYHKLFAAGIPNNEINVDQSQISHIIRKLKRKKSKITMLPEKQDNNTKTLVLDLDQTLIYSVFKPTKKYDFIIEVEVNGKIVKVYVQKRFGLDSFIYDMSQLYEIVIFSSGKKNYIDQVLAQIDPKKRISYVLSREHCTIINKSYYIKQLNSLGRDLKKTILVDDNKMAGLMNQENFYEIKPFKGNERDRNLIKLSHFLQQIQPLSSLTPIQHHRKRYELQQIDIGKCSKNKVHYNNKIQIEIEQSSQNSNTAEDTNVDLIRHLS